MRKHDLNRWNWSDRAQKWVFVSKQNGKRVYRYKDEPPRAFLDLTDKLNQLNRKLMETTDHDENLRIYKQLMKISKEMQKMRE